MLNIEKETIINFNEAQATATVYTHNVALNRKLSELTDSRPSEAAKGRTSSDYGQEYIIPKRWVKISPPRTVSEETRQRLAAQLSKARQNTQV